MDISLSESVIPGHFIGYLYQPVLIFVKCSTPISLYHLGEVVLQPQCCTMLETAVLDAKSQHFADM